MLCLFLLSPAPNLHYLKGFATRVEAWRSFAELETVFAHSGHKNNIASKTKNNIHSNKTFYSIKADAEQQKPVETQVVSNETWIALTV